MLHFIFHQCSFYPLFSWFKNDLNKNTVNYDVGANKTGVPEPNQTKTRLKVMPRPTVLKNTISE